MDAVRVRRATPDDAQAVREIIREVYVGGGWADPDRSPEYVQSLLDAEARIAQADVFVAEIDGATVGTVTATSEHPLANIAGPGELEARMLGVLDAARRRGVAKALMAACEDLARQRGVRLVVLSTEPGMHAAQELYEGLGYGRTPGRDWFIDGSKLITYAKQI